MRETTGAAKSRLRWFAGVPILTNVLIWIDMLLFSAILWSLVAIGILAIEWALSGTPSGAIPAAASFATTVSTVFLLLFIGGALLIYRNRYVVLYDLDENAASCESMLKRGGAIGESFHFRPFFVEPYYDARKSVTRQVSWTDVADVEPLGRSRTFLLRGRGWRKPVLMRVYCSNDAIYERALGAAKTAIARRNDKNGEEDRR